MVDTEPILLKKKKKIRNQNQDNSLITPTRTSITRNLFKDEEFSIPLDPSPVLKKKKKKKKKHKLDLEIDKETNILDSSCILPSYH